MPDWRWPRNLAEFHFAWKRKRGPVGDGQLTYDGENDGGAGGHERVRRGQTHRATRASPRKGRFPPRATRPASDFPKEYVAEAQGGGEVSLNAASFEGKAV